MPSDKIIKKTTRIRASPAEVWDALTTPAVIKEWLFGTLVTSDWKVGSPMLFTGTWQGQDYADKGKILKFQKGKTFQYNYWSGFSGLPDLPENYSIITFELTAVDDDATDLTLTHSHFPNENFIEHTDKNWQMTLELLKKIIEEKPA